MKRRLLILGVFVLVGAVVNVSVAWGCALWAPIKSRIDVSHLDLYETFRLSVPELDDWFRKRKFEHGYVGIEAPAITYNGPGFSVRLDTARDEVAGATKVGADRVVHTEFVGWPMPCLTGMAGVERGQDPKTQALVVAGERLVHATHVSRLSRSAERLFSFPAYERPLPLGLLWSGFATNTLIYASILWLPIPGPFAWCRWRRRRRGACTSCGYDLRHAPHEACPECGSPAAAASVVPR